MKENTKYNEFRFVGNIRVDEIQPWFDFDKGKPWDEEEVPWVLENKVRRQILIFLAENGPQNFQKIYNSLNFSPKPLLITPDEYVPRIKYQWTKETLENHLLNLEWYKLIRKRDDNYEITFPIYTMTTIEKLERQATIFAENWAQIIKSAKSEVTKELGDVVVKEDALYEILIEKTVDRLYDLLKRENLLPNIPNVRSLWAEQLRAIKFEEWVAKNF